MNIHDLPEEILEKILVEGNFLSVSRVCQTWRDHAQRKKSQFNDVFFDLTKDNPEKIEKKNLDQLFIFNSRCYDKNGICMIPKVERSYNMVHSETYFDYMYNKYTKILKKISSLNTLNFIYDPLLYIITSEEGSRSYFLSENLFTNNEDQKIIGKTSLFIGIVDYFRYLKNKIVNVEIKDISSRIRNISYSSFFDLEIQFIYEAFDYSKSFRFFKKFTFKAPNNTTYIIYDKNEKLLIIRFGNYEKYLYPKVKISICQECGKNNVICYDDNHKQYFVNCFYSSSIYLDHYYPVGLFEFYFSLISNEKIKKLIVISSEFYDFMFDRFLKTLKKIKEIEYHCFDPNKTKFERKNFKFVPVEKENEQEYSFDQIHFKYFGKNIY